MTMFTDESIARYNATTAKIERRSRRMFWVGAAIMGGGIAAVPELGAVWIVAGLVPLALAQVLAGARLVSAKDLAELNATYGEQHTGAGGPATRAG